MTDLAINGGTPVRMRPFPARAPYGLNDIREVTDALMNQDLFYNSGVKGKELEREFAELYGVPHAVCCSSGTASVHMAVAALDAEPGQEIITAPVTDFGTVAGMLFQGLIPVFADWKPGTYSIDPERIEAAITDKTAAILVVHLFGNPCDMDAVMEIARRHELPVIEDCAQAYCTTYKDALVGTIGDIGCFSMQQSKHLPTGEGGMCITGDERYAMRLTLFRDKGWENRGRWGARSYSFLGLNYRMNELTAAVARAQLRKVQGVVDTMNRLGDTLSRMIEGIDGLEPCPVTPGGVHSYWLYAFRVCRHDPEAFVKALAAEGVPASWGYTVKPIYGCTEALSEQRTFGSTSYPFDGHYDPEPVSYSEGLCPVAERELLETGTLRIYENWTESDIRDVADAFKKVAVGLPPK